MKNKIPNYIIEAGEVVKLQKVYPLKDLFLRLRKDYPEIKSMRSLRDDIEEHMDNFTVNQNNLIINKNCFIESLINIIKK